MNIRIFIAYHKESFLIKNEIFEPIQVGKTLSTHELNMIGDDTGDNISFKNSTYCELTALYWAWKNCKDLNYIGLCHYRRFFIYKKSLKDKIIFRLRKLEYIKDYYILCKKVKFVDWNNVPVKDENYLDNLIVKFTDEIIREVELNKFDIYALKPVRFYNNNIWDVFTRPSGEFVINILINIIQELYPTFYPYITKILSGQKLVYANMSIMKRNVLDEYCSFLFNVLDEHEKRTIKLGWCKDANYEKCYSRLSGYLGELILATFISHYESVNPSKVKYLFQLRLWK